ncbi:hypothetical protein [Streptomyces sp. NPDC048277]|uniref:hypothetical protein n=1 Tax=Streptomyces sp. NPDC048277 TaxID=3155027 RepID=UPI0033D0D4A2
MRALVSRGFLVSPLVCAVLVLGPAAASAAAADAGREASGPGAAQPVLPPGTDITTLPHRIDAMDTARHDRALAPLLTTLPNLTAAHGTRLDPDRTAVYAQAVRKWVSALRERLRHLDTGATDRAHRSLPRAADPVDDLVNAIQSAVDSLLGSLTSLDVDEVLSTVDDLLSPILGTVTGLLGSEVPALPALPSVDTPAPALTVIP